MADIDEDAIPNPSASTSQDASAQADQDISDETQDFRLLNSTSLLSDPTQQSLPRRGDKDFEPNPTLRQADALASARQAMHNAIAYPRLHNPKSRVIAIYCPDGTLVPESCDTDADEEGTTTTTTTTTTKATLPGESGAEKRPQTTKRKFGVGGDSCVCVPSPRGPYFKSMGQADRFNRMWLLPEEALYLLERGTLDIRWPVNGGIDSGAEIGIPMSLQAAYASFIGRGGLTLERYTVFTGLKRGGYAVVRAPSWDESGTKELSTPSSNADGEPAAPKSSSYAGLTGVVSRLFSLVYNCRVGDTANHATGPVIGLGIHRSYSDIFRALSVIPSHDPTFPDPSTPPSTNPPYRLAFDVYKPSTVFRKSSRGTPDFQLAVISARDNPTLPTLDDLSALLANTQLCPPHGEKMDRLLYMRLRHGWRNVILAVVDQGVVSFLRVADAGFGMEKLYAAKHGEGQHGKGGRRPAGKKGRR